MARLSPGSPAQRIRAMHLPTFALVTVLTAASLASQQTASYDPLRVDDRAQPQGQLFDVHDAARDRTLPIRVYLAANTAPAPVILFSHGLGGSRDTSPYLGEHWSRRGYVVVFLQHPGSDTSVWKDAPLRDRMKNLKAAANAKELRERCLDVHAVLDQLTAWNDTDDHALHRRLDLDHVGMCGHSFGAFTTQMTSGQNVPLLGQQQLDPRIDAALPMSPSSPAAGDLSQAFGKVTIPWLCMTGTEDVSPIGNQDAASRQKVFANLPDTIDRYELVLDGAEHSAFVGGEGLARVGRRNPNHHRAILALSTAFWDAYLKGDAAARAWLQGDAARSVLEDADRWQAEPAGK